MNKLFVLLIAFGIISMVCCESGKCSWYGPGADGGTTACGTIFYMMDMTAAHPSLPCFTKIRVDANGRSVQLTVTDRGPFVPGRILNLSKGGAQVVGMIDKGVVDCNVTPI